MYCSTEAGTCLLPTGKTQSQALCSSLLQELHSFRVWTLRPAECPLRVRANPLRPYCCHLPWSDPRGCNFNYTKAIWRNLQRIDLVPEHQVEGSEVRKSFKMKVALPASLCSGGRHTYCLKTPQTNTCQHAYFSGLRVHLGWIVP